MIFRRRKKQVSQQELQKIIKEILEEILPKFLEEEKIREETRQKLDWAFSKTEMPHPDSPPSLEEIYKTFDKLFLYAGKLGKLTYFWKPAIKIMGMIVEAYKKFRLEEEQKYQRGEK